MHLKTVYPVSLERNAAAGSASTSALIFGGSSPSSPTPPTATNSYDGTSWTAQPNMSAGKYNSPGAGTSSAAALAFLGSPPPTSVNTEEFTAAAAAVKTVTTS